MDLFRVENKDFFFFLKKKKKLKVLTKFSNPHIWERRPQTHMDKRGMRISSFLSFRLEGYS